MRTTAGSTQECWFPMAEPPAAPPERIVLLGTKVQVPALRPGVVPRPHLAARLDGAGGVTLVCAPAGYGKTVLLAQWASRAERPAAWLSLDRGDNDPIRFWRHTVAALDQARPGISEQAAPLLGPPAPLSFEPLLTLLINELASQPGGRETATPLILDDYHLISAEQVHASLEFLIDHRPAGLHLVLASRSDPPLPLPRLRARGQLAELRASDLQFTAAEAAALLRQVAGGGDAPLPDSAAELLAARTEGWAAGLQLAGLGLRGEPDIERFVRAFTGSNRHVVDYLAEEVLERQTEQVRTFLLETSVLERLSGPLCDAVTGRAGSQALLEQVEQAGLFLVPLDDTRGWWRYHRLFADLLRGRLQRQGGRMAELHDNAAAWYEQRGLPDDAIHHAVAAGEPARAARLIEAYFDESFWLRGEEATIQRWLAALPGGVIESRPRLLLAQAQLASASGRVESIEGLIDAAERAAAGTAAEPFEPTIGTGSSMLVNVAAHIALDRCYLAQLRGDAEATAAFAAQALAELAEGEWMLRSIAQGLLAVAEWLRGHLAQSEAAFVSSLTAWHVTDQPTVTVWGSYQLARVQCARGRLDAAVRTCQQALEIITRPGRPPLAAAGPMYAALGEIAYQRGDLDAALQYLGEGIPLCRQFVYTTPLTAALTTVAWIRQATGDPAGALDALTEASQTSQVTTGLVSPIQAQRARLLLAQGDAGAAASWMRESGLGADDEPYYPLEAEQLTVARILLAQGRPAQAQQLLERLHAAATAQDRTSSRIEIAMLLALARAALGQDTAAVATLTGALALACPQGSVRIFADEGPLMTALLHKLIAAQRTAPPAGRIPLGYLARLLHACTAERPGRPAAALPGLVEPLTRRELEILGLLAAGTSNSGIARELVISPDTVKKHVSHILGKLGAASRTEAVARARALEWIP
jgi:LuxR family transcriptional regulator, maltose regulon positive regulatory protein